MTAARKPATTAARRPAAAKVPQDRKAPDAVSKPKVKKIKGGHEVTLHGATVTVLDSALGDFETADDLALLQEAFEAAREGVDAAAEDLAREASGRVPGLMRRLIGPEGTRSVYRVLRKENDGALDFDAVVGFLGDLMAALSPNS